MRKILSVLTGLITSAFVLAFVEWIAQAAFPPSEAFDPQSPDLSLVPTMTVVIVGVAWLVGPMVGGFVATRMGRTHAPTVALIVGGAFLAADIAHLVMLSAPAWLWVVGIVAPVIGAYAGFLGGRADADAPTDD